MRGVGWSGVNSVCVCVWGGGGKDGLVVVVWWTFHRPCGSPSVRLTRPPHGHHHPPIAPIAEIEALLGEVMTTCEKIRTVNAQGETWLQREYRKPGPMMVGGWGPSVSACLPGLGCCCC